MKDNKENNLSEKDVTENRATDQEKRRKAVKNILMVGGTAITAGQVAGTKWTKPVIESVVLPAHAATSGPGFSINDPVSLAYQCSDSGSDVVIDVTGYIDQPIAGIKVRLVLTWENTRTPDLPTETPPLILNLVTDSNGNYASTGNNIGYTLDTVSVIASLPDYPDAGTDDDQISVDVRTITGGDYTSYYCAAPTTLPPG